MRQQWNKTRLICNRFCFSRILVILHQNLRPQRFGSSQGFRGDIFRQIREQVTSHEENVKGIKLVETRIKSVTDFKDRKAFARQEFRHFMKKRSPGTVSTDQPGLGLNDLYPIQEFPGPAQYLKLGALHIDFQQIGYRQPFFLNKLVHPKQLNCEPFIQRWTPASREDARTEAPRIGKNFDRTRHLAQTDLKDLKIRMDLDRVLAKL